MVVIQPLEAGLRRSHHQRKPPQSIALHAHLHHLVGLVVDRIQDQRAHALIALGFA